ncbi:uncharacterized protein LOC130010336 [Patella vulgata]|uniref:uncharacterized protein LOC130010336 n=1 Tax=Patella vulgata TaxID=6465 RepID=UPI00217FC676|nr:uncharacterized protein LOC130010336 [Patella vulgata]
MCNYGILATIIVILIGLCMTGTYGMADECINGPDIVPVCSNVTMSTNDMFIPVNSSIGTGCMCDVQLVDASGDAWYNVAFIGVDVNNLTCGYQMQIEKTISCSEHRSILGRWRLDQIYSLRFTRDSTPNPPSTAGFCFRVISVTRDATGFIFYPDARFKMKCWYINTPTTTDTLSSSPFLSPITNIQNATISSQQATQSSDRTSTPKYNSKREVTDNLIDEKLPVAAIGGGIGGAVLLLIVFIAIVFLCKRRQQNDYDKPSNRIRESTNYNNVRVKDEMIITDNDLYVSYDDDKNQSTTSPTSDLQTVQGHTYANTNGPLSSDTNHSTPDLQHVQGHTYANFAGQQPSNTNQSTSDQHLVQPSVTTSDNKSTQDDMIILENDLYVSADSIPNSSATENKLTCHEQLDKRNLN